MIPMEPDSRLDPIARRLTPGGCVIGAWRLTGGVSAQVVAVEIETPGKSRRKVVIRQHGEADRRRNPQIAQDEFRLLRTLHALHIPVPEPLLADDTGEIFPTPYLVTIWIDGTTDFSPDDPLQRARQLADVLSRIHQVDVGHADLRFLPPHPALALDSSQADDRIRTALDTSPPVEPNPPALLHGDFWPGNVLWRGAHLAAVIDWEDAAIGDPLIDLANGRLEVLWAYGAAAMDAFTAQYQSHRPGLNYRHLPYQDVCAALSALGSIMSWGLDAVTLARMQADLRGFIDRALERLTVGGE
jgi:aminoglycoside phosphotransferase (APT) family kinase protein